jgi:hypothetical protein
LRRRRNAGVRRKNIDKARRDDAQHTQAPFGFKLYVMRDRDFIATSEFRRLANSTTIPRESMSADSTAAAALPADLSGLEGVIHSLLLSALEKIADRTYGATLQSDDQSRRPLAIAETDSSIESSVRSPAEPRETVLRVGSLELDLINRTAKRGDRPVDLLPSEFRLLKYMMQRGGQLLTRATLPGTQRLRSAPSASASAPAAAGFAKSGLENPEDRSRIP